MTIRGFPYGFICSFFYGDLICMFKRGVAY